jgi:glycosyltransferase involved in cell wall biosynthesis
MPKVSVIISSRNRIKLLLERCLRSVANQTYRDFEVILIDDASEQDYSIIARGDIKIYKNLIRKGLAWNKNFGISESLGEYIVFLDDDNEFHPEFLDKTVSWLDWFQNVDAVGVDKIVVYPEGRLLHRPKLPCSINDGFLIRREVFDKIKFDAKLQANEDADFGIQFFRAGFKMGLIDKPLMTVWGSAIFNKTSYSDYTDYHLDGLAKFWIKNHKYKKYIGRMFLLSAGSPKWFKWLYWLEQKVKRYYQIWSSPARH